MMNTRHSNNAFNYDYDKGQWCVILRSGQVAYVGDKVKVEFDNGTFEGTIKQVSGFGPKEKREVVSVLFPNRSNGVKVLVDNVIEKL